MAVSPSSSRALSLLAALILPTVCERPLRAQTAVTDPAPFLTTNLLNGIRGERLNMVVFGDGYTTNETALFQTHVTNVVMNYFFTIEPFKSYKNYFNVFSITPASLESGSDHPSLGTYKDTYFDSTFDTSGIARLLTLKQSGRVYTLVSQFVPEYNVLIVIVNDATYGGSGGSLAVSSVNGSSPQVMAHEIGHSFGQLADEYDTYTPGYSPYERVNCTAETNRPNIKWTAWIEGGTPVPTPATSTWDAYPGLFEGCMYTTTGWFRPHYNSFMRSLGRPTGPVNIDHMVKRIYKHSPDNIEPFRFYSPTNTALALSGVSNLVFSVSPIKPVFHELSTEWFADGQRLTAATETNLVISSFLLGNGRHYVSNRVFDATSQVRIHTNAYFSSSPLQKWQSWTIDLASQSCEIHIDRSGVGSTDPAADAVVPFGCSTSVTAAAGAWYHIGSVTTNGADVAFGISNVTVSLPDLRGDVTVSVVFAPNLAAHETPEWWLARHFGTAVPFAVSATNDADGDGMASWAEYRAGTDPTNAASVLRLEGTSLSADALVLRWRSDTGRTYQIEYSTNLLLAPPFVPLGNPVQGAFGETTLTDDTPVVEGQRFYRIRMGP